MKVVLIWLTGLLASAMWGAGLMTLLAPNDSGAGLFGLIAGALTFACVRLWIGERQ